MVLNKNKLKGKIVENGLTTKILASKLGVCEKTIKNKMDKEGVVDFSIEQSVQIGNILKLSEQEYLDIFYGGKLEFNS